MRPHAAALVALALSAASARAGSLSGRVVERGARSPLGAAEVVVRAAADSSVIAHGTTGDDGRFRLAGLAPGRYRLRASLVGYAPLVRGDLELTAAAPDADLGDLALTVVPVAVPGVTTSTARATAIVAPDRNIYLTKDMPAAAAGTATDVLRAVPELDVDINGAVSLRGSSSLTVQINGRPAPMTGEALQIYLRQFPANRIEKIEVVANPSARFNPEGTGGIVNIVLKDGVDLGLSGSVYASLGSNSASPGARLAWQKGPLTLFGGLSAYGNRNHSTYTESRDNLLAQPPTHYRVEMRNANRGASLSPDLSADFGLSKRATLYTTVNGWLSGYSWGGLTHYALLDDALAPTLRYDRDGDSDNDSRSGTVTLGVRHVVTQGRDERSLELRQSDMRQDYSSLTTQFVFVPADSAGPDSRMDGALATHERSLEADDTHPLGDKAKLEIGYRASERRNTNSRDLRFREDGVEVVTPLTSRSDYEHRETFHSGYVTFGAKFGRASVQVGARAEAAHTTFEVRRAGARYGHDYRSVFPSANVAWDYGRGVTTRFTYSKRIERPAAWYLNPDMPTTDPLNRTVGNPQLDPKYTHSWSLESSWNGSRGSLRLAPYFRRTVDNWDQYVTVDTAGVATTTWRNASSIDYFGTSLTASYRQVKRLGGTAGLSLFREHHDASNLAGTATRTATNWSATGNVTYKLLEPLDLQLWTRYSPAQTLAQGRTAASLMANLGARWKLGKQASLGLWVSDPFDTWKSETSTRDATHASTTTNRYTMRAVTLNLSWSWGKPPEQKPRKQTDSAPQQEPGGGGP